MTTIYLYDKNGIFIGSRRATLRPNGKGEILDVTNGTVVSPPALQDGTVAVWNGGTWSIVEDNRGKKFWLQGDSWDSTPRTMQALGPLPDGATTERPPLSATEAAYCIRAERDRRIAVTDYLLAADYPISADKLELVKAYRQALRDIPQQDGFPWSGEIDDPAIPWPVLDEAATQATR